MKNTCLLLGFILMTSVSVNAQWQWQNPQPQGNHLRSVSFVDRNNGWAVGDHGTILNWNGTQWSNQQSQYMDNFRTVFFTDASNGWAAGQNGIIHHYNGTKWGLDYSFYRAEISAMYFLDKNHGWAVTSRSGYLLTYSYGNWTYKQINTNFNFYGVSFTDTLHGWITGMDQNMHEIIVKTDGKNWSTQLTSPNWGTATAIYMTDSLHGWVSAGKLGDVYKYNGTTWTTETTGCMGHIHSIQFIDTTYGIVTTEHELGVYRLGTWSVYNLPGDLNLNAATFTDTLYGWGVGAAGDICKIDTFKGKVISRGTTENLNSVSFVNVTNGWTVGEKGTILKYNGTSWVGQTSGTTKTLNAVNFKDLTHGWAVGDSGTILKYNGSSWTAQNCPTTATLYSVSFADITHGLAVGDSGIILFYNGTKWSKMISPTTQILYSVHYLDTKHAWTAGDYSIILKYNGKNWITELSDSGYAFRSIFFTDTLHGWAIGDRPFMPGITLAMKYDGKSWKKPSNIGWDIGRSIFFNDSLFGNTLLFGEVVKMNQTGTINHYMPVSGNDLNCITFINNTQGWVVGNYGTILYTNNGGDGSPNATVLPATNVTKTSVDLHGVVNALNSSTSVIFTYSEYQYNSYYDSIFATPSLVSGSNNTLVDVTLTGLSPSTTYYYNIKAGNSIGSTFGTEGSFTTPDVPVATTLPATQITAIEATLNGSVDANNSPSTTSFEYGLTTSYGNTIKGSPEIAKGDTVTTISAAISSLNMNSTYHFRIKAVNTFGTNYGNDLTFTTTSKTSAVTNAASNIGINGASLNGIVNANNLSTAVTFEYGQTTAYGSTKTASPSPVSGNTNTAVSYNLTGLKHSTQYHYRVVAKNSSETAYGKDTSFLTLDTLPILSTTAVSAITKNSAQTGGNITNDGGSSIINRGVVWNTSANPTIVLPNKTSDGTGQGIYSSTLSGLLPNTTYYIRAFASNAAGTSYGNELNFKTSVNSISENDFKEVITISTYDKQLKLVFNNDEFIGGNLMIMNLVGQIIKEINIEDFEYHIALSSIPDGIYILKITNQDKCYTKTILLK